MDYVIQVLRADDDQTLARCFGVFSVLRPHLSEAVFTKQVRLQSSEGYKIAYIETDGEIVAAAGYRVATFLAWGKVLYIDDLITHPQRTRAGLGGALIDWLLEQGRLFGCDQAHLDTGHQRHDAHRLYVNKGFLLSSHHMSVSLK